MRFNHKKLSELREYYDMSQRELARVAGISNAEISRIESGQRKSPGINTVLKFCKVFNINIEDFLV